MSKQQIENLKKEFNLPIEVCVFCLGDGEIIAFYGHYVIETCGQCNGKGYINKD